MAESSTSPELKTLIKVVTRLDQASIPYMLTGSMALNFYGHPRATNDFDIVIRVHPKDTETFFNLFKDDFYMDPDTLNSTVQQGGVINAIDQESVFKVDFIIGGKDDFSAEHFQRRRLIELNGLKVSVISPEDLILCKLDWSRESLSEMQERDIKNVLRLLAQELDMNYIEKWAKHLGLLERLRGLRAST